MANETLNRSELVAKVAAKTGLTQTAVDTALSGTFDVILSEVSKGVKVTIPGYLAVERTHRAARTGRNPQTGAAIQIAATNTVKVSAGSKLKASVK